MRIGRDVKEDHFVAKVERWVESAISPGITDFDDLLNRLPGVYPTAVPPALSALFAEGHLDADTLARLQPRSATKPQLIPTAYSLLPLPHPLDFEWRFSAQSARLLLDLANDSCRPGETVLLFGTPGLALHAISQRRAGLTTFFGEDNSVTRRLIALNRAVDRPLSIQLCSLLAPTRGSASVVILDPPWYLDFIRPMLATAAAACSLGGYLLISLPPEGSQSSAAEDRTRVLAFADRLGLRAVATHALALTYETPFFEKNALAACGLHVRDPWRRSDLVVFRKIVDTNRPFVTTTIRKDRWCEIEIGRMRLFVRRDVADSEKPSLRSLVDADILPTVSRRDRRRDQAQLWTSGNRIFASSAPDLVISAALAVSGDLKGSGPQPQLCGSMQEREEIDRLCLALRALVLTEAAEERAMHAPAVEEWSKEWASTSIRFCSELMEIASG